MWTSELLDTPILGPWNTVFLQVHSWPSGFKELKFIYFKLGDDMNVLVYVWQYEGTGNLLLEITHEYMSLQFKFIVSVTFSTGQ
jgi:hypothetical protein